MARILIVEDEFLIAMSLESSLAEAGHVVRLARNGREALDMMGEFAPDLVLTDYMMPVMDGAELISRLRADPAWSGLKIIMTTAIPKSNLDGIVQEFDHYIGKPIRHDELFSLLECLFESR